MEEIGKILPASLRPHLQGRESDLINFLQPLWERVAGRLIAEHSQPVAFEAGTLTLATVRACWESQLRLMAEEIRAAINSFLGRPLVRKLRVRHATKLDRGAASPAEPRCHAKAETPPEPEMDANLDPEMAHLLARSFAKYFARGRSPVN